MAHPQSCGTIASPDTESSIEDLAILSKSSKDPASDFAAAYGTWVNGECEQLDRRN